MRIGCAWSAWVQRREFNSASTSTVENRISFFRASIDRMNGASRSQPTRNAPEMAPYRSVARFRRSFRANGLFAVTPDDFGYWEIQDKLTSSIAGFHGILPNM